jgi:hypothetical protein
MRRHADIISTLIYLTRCAHLTRRDAYRRHAYFISPTPTRHFIADAYFIYFILTPFLFDAYFILSLYRYALSRRDFAYFDAYAYFILAILSLISPMTPRHSTLFYFDETPSRFDAISRDSFLFYRQTRCDDAMPTLTRC